MLLFQFQSESKKHCQEAEYLKFHKKPLGVCILNGRIDMPCHFDKLTSSPWKDEQGRLHDMALRAAHHARDLAFVEDTKMLGSWD